MLVLLNAGFGTALPLSDWSAIRELGWAGIRNDVPDPHVAPDIVINMASGGGLMNIAIANARGTIDDTLAISESVAVSAKATGMTDRLALEVGNEEDVNGRWGDDPVGYGHLVAAVWDIVDRVNPRLKVVTGGIGTLSKDALVWLGSAIPYVPHSVAVGYHPYRSTAPGIPRDGFASREAEFASLRAIAGDRKLWCTEVGWHTAPRPMAFPLCLFKERWSDGEVASFLRSELRLNHEAGAEVACVFQLNDSNRNEPEGRFGIRKLDGAWKPSSAVAREWRA